MLSVTFLFVTEGAESFYEEIFFFHLQVLFFCIAFFFFFIPLFLIAVPLTYPHRSMSKKILIQQINMLSKEYIYIYFFFLCSLKLKNEQF